MLEKYKILEKAISTYGRTSQTIMAMEEMAELIQALSKDLRGFSKKENIIEEIADVNIMLKQIMVIHNISDREIENEMDFKITRLNNRINEMEGKA